MSIRIPCQSCIKLGLSDAEYKLFETLAQTVAYDESWDVDEGRIWNREDDIGKVWMSVRAVGCIDIPAGLKQL